MILTINKQIVLFFSLLLFVFLDVSAVRADQVDSLIKVLGEADRGGRSQHLKLSDRKGVRGRLIRLLRSLIQKTVKLKRTLFLPLLS